MHSHACQAALDYKSMQAFQVYQSNVILAPLIICALCATCCCPWKCKAENKLTPQHQSLQCIFNVYLKRHTQSARIVCYAQAGQPYAQELQQGVHASVVGVMCELTETMRECSPASVGL